MPHRTRRLQHAPTTSEEQRPKNSRGSHRAQPKAPLPNSVERHPADDVAIFEDSAECVAVLDPRGKLLRMNAKGLETLKIKSFSKVHNSPWIDLWDKDYRREITQAIKSANKHQTTKLKNIKSTTNGTQLWWDMIIIPASDAQGAVKYLLILCHDITQLKESEQTLRYYALLIQNVTDAIISSDMNLKILSWNKGAEKLYGWREKDAIGKAALDHISTVFPNNDRDTVIKELHRTGTWKGELTQKDKYGHTHDILATFSMVKDKAGKNIGIVGVNKDVTEANKTNHRLQQAKLQRQLMRHKAEILKHQNEELLALNRTKDEFIAVASHQLRTPATGVKQYLGLLLQGYSDPLTPSQEVFLQKAQVSNDRQLRIIDELLKVAQVDAGNLKLRKRPTDIGQLVDEVLADLKDKTKKQQQKITFRTPDPAVIAPVDSSQIRMVLENIIDNASNYSPPKAHITIGVRSSSRQTVITIQDEGVGIDSGDFPKLFQKFSRIHNPLSVEVGGTGLGLYWAKKIVTLHGGSITVKSTLAKGSTFTIKLPGK